ncbi:hypothetical protein E4U41_005953 [Claviceps citrina]|nr:hypothetical protein E4U41_005953 [Claviceps citrina]
MPPTAFHPFTLFFLVPVNHRAREALNDVRNAHLVSWFDENDPDNRNASERGETTSGFGIGLHTGSKSRYTLATIGRDGDIKVNGSCISRRHCSFEIPDGNHSVIMFEIAPPTV